MGIREKVAETARNVPIRLGPNAIALAQDGLTIRLSGNEADRVADAAMEVVNTRVRELEEENQRIRDAIAAQIVEQERQVQQKILKDSTNPALAGLLVGLQRARDIVLTRQLKEEA